MSSMSSSSIVQVRILPHFLDQCRSMSSNKFVLSMVIGHHLQLQKWPQVLCNFKLFNIKGAATHCPIIQENVQELLAKGAIEPSSGGPGFYSNVFVVPKHVGGSWPIFNLK